uniref:Ig-like domain-containing protein n=1 Tax=Chrysemys picta bellii TaxID=8478 RepID=A0A8C3HBU7_CHRPI
FSLPLFLPQPFCGPPPLWLTPFLSAVQDPPYQITQPGSLSAPAGGSVILPCAFTYSREIEPLRDLRVYWRRGGFHGEFIYNHTEGFTHPDYGGRIILVRDPRGSQTALIRIDRLRESDASEYVCHVRVQKNNGEWEQWRSVLGTNLTVTAPSPTDSTWHPEMVTTGAASAGRTCPGASTLTTSSSSSSWSFPRPASAAWSLPWVGSWEGGELSTRHPQGMTPSSSSRMAVILQQNTR